MRAALGEAFGYPVGACVTGKMAAALHELGFDEVFDTNFAADLTILEEGTELLGRLESALTGGVMEAALRTVCELVTGRELPFENLHVTPIEGLEQIKTASVTLRDTLPAYRHLEGVEVRVAVTSGLAGADRLMREIAKGQSPYHFIEVMGCPGGVRQRRRPAAHGRGELPRAALARSMPRTRASPCARVTKTPTCSVSTRPGWARWAVLWRTSCFFIRATCQEGCTTNGCHDGARNASNLSVNLVRSGKTRKASETPYSVLVRAFSGLRRYWQCRAERSGEELWAFSLRIVFQARIPAIRMSFPFQQLWAPLRAAQDSRTGKWQE